MKNKLVYIPSSFGDKLINYLIFVFSLYSLVFVIPIVMTIMFILLYILGIEPVTPISIIDGWLDYFITGHVGTVESWRIHLSIIFVIGLLNFNSFE